MLRHAPLVTVWQHPHGKLVQHPCHFEHHGRIVHATVYKLFVSRDQSDLKPRFLQSTVNRNSKICDRSTLSTRFLQCERNRLFCLHRLRDRFIHRQNHWLLMGPQAKRLPLDAGAGFITPQCERAKEKHIIHARLVQSIAKPGVFQRPLAAADSPAEISDWFFRHKVIIKRGHARIV